MVHCCSQLRKAKKTSTQNFLGKMRDDTVRVAIEGDMRIIEYGKRLYSKYGMQNRNHISQKLRELGRLLLKVRSVSTSVRTLDDCLETRNWDIITAAVKDLAGYDGSTTCIKHHQSLCKLVMA